MPQGLDSNLMGLNYKDFTFNFILIIFIVDFLIYTFTSFVIQDKDYFGFSILNNLKMKIRVKEFEMLKMEGSSLNHSENKCKF